MSWYYVDKEGQTQGGFEVSVLKQKYASKQVDGESYVWNGTSVNQWTPLKNVPELLNQLKPAQAPSRPSRPARKSPFGGGGGRANFLASIQKGAQLKKVEKKDTEKPAPKSGGGGGGFGGGMDLMSQLRAKQNAMKKKGTIGGAAKGPKPGGGAKSGPRPSGGAKKKWGTSSTTTSGGSTGPKKWGKPTSSPSKSYGGGGSSSARITKIKNKLDSAQDWQLKAIEKILS